MMRRLKAIDELRGAAIAFMAINHAGHYLTPDRLPVWAYYSIYVTVTLAAPFFLFLSGLSMSLSLAKVGLERGPSLFGKYLKRGLSIIACGWLVNLIFYNSEPLWRGRILQTIGLSIIMSYPLYRAIGSRQRRLALAALAVAGLLLFPWMAPLLRQVPADQFFAQMFISEFPIMPWFFLFVLGLAVGREMTERRADLSGRNGWMLAAGLALLVVWLTLSCLLGGGHLLSFGNDLEINGYWTPAPLTWLWICGWFLLLAFGAQKKILPNIIADNLSKMGQNSLILYFLQFILIIGILWWLLNIELYGIIPFAIINLIIIIILCLSAKYSGSARNMALSLLKPKARIS